MNVYKITVDVWVVGEDKKEAITNLMDDLSYLGGLDEEYIKVVGYKHPEEAQSDEEATKLYEQNGYVGYYQTTLGEVK
jgi:hypothetical protein